MWLLHLDWTTLAALVLVVSVRTQFSFPDAAQIWPESVHYLGRIFLSGLRDFCWSFSSCWSLQGLIEQLSDPNVEGLISSVKGIIPLPLVWRSLHPHIQTWHECKVTVMLLSVKLSEAQGLGSAFFGVKMKMLAPWNPEDAQQKGILFHTYCSCLCCSLSMVSSLSNVWPASPRAACPAPVLHPACSLTVCLALRTPERKGVLLFCFFLFYNCSLISCPHNRLPMWPGCWSWCRNILFSAQVCCPASNSFSVAIVPPENNFILVFSLCNDIQHAKPFLNDLIVVKLAVVQQN